MEAKVSNILIVGFHPHSAEAVRESVENILKQINKADDAITTILPANTKWCIRAGEAPYLVVRNTDLDEAITIAAVLNAGIKVDVECEKIDHFFAGPVKDPEVPA